MASSQFCMPISNAMLNILTVTYTVSYTVSSTDKVR